MPIYEFSDPISKEPISVECEDDDMAWSDAVTMCGQMLKDLDGRLPSPTNWTLTVREGTRKVAVVKLDAHRYLPLKSVPRLN